MWFTKNGAISFFTMGPIDKSVVGGPIAYPSQPKGIPKNLEDNLFPMGPTSQDILKQLYTWATTKLTYLPKRAFFLSKDQNKYLKESLCKWSIQYRSAGAGTG